MKTSRRGFVLVVCWVLFLVPGAFNWGQEVKSGPPSDKERADTTLKLALAKASQFEIHLDDSAQTVLTLHPRSVLRWSNPVSTALYGEVFVWTAAGRPEVIASMHKFFQPDRRHMTGEFHSLALGKLVATQEKQNVWNPQEAGVTLADLPGAPPVARAAQQRLSQMRALARGFSAESSARNEPDTREQLRLLPKPIFRYESSNPALLDGGIFAFVQGTNPEVLLLLEARQSGDAYRWQYALARFNSVALRASHQQQQVWSVPQIAPPWEAIRDPAKAYFVPLLDPGE